MTPQEAKDKELNPHNYSEGRFKYPLNHRECGRTTYFYKKKPVFGEIPAFEYLQRVSLDQPVVQMWGGVSCPYCQKPHCINDLVIDEAQEMSDDTSRS